jgi:hypothetical protein
MINCAHASPTTGRSRPECQPENLARSDWLIARVYSVVGRAEPALAHAGRCLELCERH